jgi:hypothetical protein
MTRSKVSGIEREICPRRFSKCAVQGAFGIGERGNTPLTETAIPHKICITIY